LGLVGRRYIFHQADFEKNQGSLLVASSDWVAIAKSEHSLLPLSGSKNWKPLAAPSNMRAWTDNFSNVLRVVRW
jgi:hypothetical protein